MRRFILKGGDFACDLLACWECALRSSFLDHLQIKAPDWVYWSLGEFKAGWFGLGISERTCLLWPCPPFRPPTSGVGLVPTPPLHLRGWLFVHLQQLQRLGVGARAPSSEFGAKDKRTTMLLIVLSPSWVEIRRTQAPILIRVLHACVGTHGSPGHVCHWVGTPSLEEEAPWATIFPGWCG